MQLKQALHINKNKKSMVLILIMLFMLFGTFSSSLAQSKKTRYKGAFLGGQKNWNIFKSRKKYKNIGTKKTRKNLSKKDNFKRKRQLFKRNNLKRFNRKNAKFKKNGRLKTKNTRLGKKGSLYSYNKKKNKKRKGKFPKSKRQINGKISVYAGSGLVFTQTNEQEDLSLQEQVPDIYSNYRTSAHLTAGLTYNKSNQLSFGADVKAFSLRNDLNQQLRLNTLALNGFVKYNFVSTSKRLSPYVTFGPTFTFVQFTQEEGSQELEVDSTIANGVDIIRIRRNTSSFRTSVVPLIGFKLGLGADFKLTNDISGFAQVDFDYSAARGNRQLLDFFPVRREADFIFYTISVGLRYHLFRRSSLY